MWFNFQVAVYSPRVSELPRPADGCTQGYRHAGEEERTGKGSFQIFILHAVHNIIQIFFRHTFPEPVTVVV